MRKLDEPGPIRIEPGNAFGDGERQTCLANSTDTGHTDEQNFARLTVNWPQSPWLQALLWTLTTLRRSPVARFQL
jgi:hypothetical protein